MQLLLLLQQLKNITINLFMDADYWGSGIAATEQERGEDGFNHHNVQLEWIGWEGTDGLPTPQTQQPTAELNQGRIGRVCVANVRGEGCKHTTICRMRGLDVMHNYVVCIVVYITLKLIDITTQNFQHSR
jgi:hypothetical protein